jgi:protein-S-isoprenylcysteine O-methyltransferase Ste14
MGRVLSAAFGVASYVYFLGVFVYFILFVGDLWVPKSISSEPGAEGLGAVVWDTALLVIFGVQHSVMARKPFKQWLCQYIPQHLERSVYVLASSVVLAWVMWAWQPVNSLIWNFEAPVAVGVIYGFFFLGWGVIFLATFLTDHFDLFGLRQVYLNFMQKEYKPLPFTEKLLYKFVRHPMMTGIMIAFWATPYMTVGHLVLSVVFTGYVLYGVKLEETGLVEELGPEYEKYRERTNKFLPF